MNPFDANYVLEHPTSTAVMPRIIRRSVLRLAAPLLWAVYVKIGGPNG
jgi:hypothetical protein